MPPPEQNFVYSDTPEAHRVRTKKLLQGHPEVRYLIERNPLSGLLVRLIVGMQIVLALLFAGQSWWVALLVAYVVGTVANHALFVLIHECARNLVLKNKPANILLTVFADVPNEVPRAISFRDYHLQHHSFQGTYDVDADLANRWAERLVGNSFLGKAVWLLFFPVFQALRPPRLRELPLIDGWTLVNWLVVFSFDAAVVLLVGPVALLYLAASLSFAVGLHPLGGRWIQEHYLISPPEETYSYYGRLNIPALNVGFDNEDHDVPSIPWNNLPKVTRAAPELYDGLVSHRSWAKLLWRFLSDKNLSLYSRMVRTNRGGLAVQPE
jgi:sphingolipid delta-4 desaturase